ncbi:hypothetical protein [Legionella pneumophila]|uniref:Substrate of the Dot/Icm secretion system n=1 Tax=Legionella pneumophila subsp. pascullei TaxID=91890 RepID=A0AAX2IZ47_LEGPN|nr:hypothetical protein [Legionella pneumophila]AMP90131.1 type IV secretion protein Dot [Legionella pneumophila subsp. pascullei]AMP92201.1 type IV secretion protein Dot [Legionella pneumophila subsp. pascullei]AMP95166.1 type IV secretion protein Dot [Legionella pneumophila subsp. pascullei]SQG90049.1 substrate of the Dot/Icm secretion system [Legionella pneumophila subsp. pascullei]VEH05932.1 substrate of the Dot/Icm secretion system [Legionella pneumophila subsp. pascullei]
MKELMAFIHDLYEDRTGKSVKFESKRRDLIVSPLMSKDDAQALFKSLKQILPEEARLKVRESKQEPGQFRVVLFNSEKIFSFYAKRAAELLNRFRPLPISTSEEKYYKWEYNPSSKLIEYRVTFSVLDLDKKEKATDTDEIAKELKVADQYNKKLQLTYPGLTILGCNSDDGGDDRFFLALNYSHYKAINNPPSLRDIGIEFFRKHTEHYTTEVSKNLPKEVTDELPDAKPSSAKPSSTGS